MKKVYLVLMFIISFFLLISCDLKNETSTSSNVTTTTRVTSTSQITSLPTSAVSTTSSTSTSTTVSTTSSTTTTTIKPEITSDPYNNVSKNEFYANYVEAESYMHAQYRTQHNLMSGSIDDKDRYYLPTQTSNLQYRVVDANYTYRPNGEYESYTINYTNGDKDVIYYGGAYVGLNEVCAYILAFGEVPPNSNYSSSSTGKKNSVADWGKYGRCNIGTYSNNVVKYPYEPELPTKSASGTVYKYTETDFGSTGGFASGGGYYTDEYNNGSSISRGSCRIVFTNNARDIRERLVFYTYNHYNDFQEYLNYYNGFGTRFGNISNGGVYNSGSNPSPYIKTQDITLIELRRLLGL